MEKSEKIKGNHYIERIFKSFVMFLFLFEINMSAWGFPTLATTRRIVVLLMFLWTIIFYDLPKMSNSRIGSSYKRYMLIHVGILLYVALITFMIGRGTGVHALDTSIKFLYMAVIGTYGLLGFFKNLEEFMQCLLIAVLAQGFFIVLFAVAPSVKEAVDGFIGLQEDAESLWKRGYYTGLACHASLGMLKMMPGLIACGYFILTKPKNGKYICFYIFITLTATVVARTGLVMGIVGMIILLTRLVVFDLKKFGKVVIIVVAMFVMGGIVINLLGAGQIVEDMFERLFYLFEVGGDEAFFDGYWGGKVPAFSWKLLVGTGVTSGTSANGLTVNVDGGFLRNYVALGLPVALIFYITTLYYTLRPLKTIKDKNIRSIVIFFAAYFFIGEFKEYFLFSAYMFSVFFAFLKLWEREKNRGI